MSDPVNGGDEDPVRDGVAPLDRAPGVVLRLPRRRALGRMPADGAWIDQYLGAGECAQSRRFRKPLVPADQRADVCEAGLEHRIAQITRSEIELLVVERIVRNVGLAVASQQGAIGIDHDDGVVIHAGTPLFKERHYQHDRQVSGEGGIAGGRWAWDRFGEVEGPRVLALREIVRGKELLQADDLRALVGGLPDESGCGVEVGRGGLTTGHLYEAHRERIG